jgi:hypothetical protein
MALMSALIVSVLPIVDENVAMCSQELSSGQMLTLALLRPILVFHINLVAQLINNWPPEQKGHERRQCFPHD